MPEEKLEEQGYKVSVMVVEQLLKTHGFRPRQAFKTEAGEKGIPQCDEQFKILNLEKSVPN